MDLDFWDGYSFRRRYEADDDSPNDDNSEHEKHDSVTKGIVAVPNNNSLLSKILDSGDQIDENSIPKVEMKTAERDTPNEGMCVECEDQPIAVACNQCNDKFCEVCFLALHKKGSRKQHTFVKLNPDVKFHKQVTNNTLEATANDRSSKLNETNKEEEDKDDNNSTDVRCELGRIGTDNVLNAGDGAWFTERSRWIPLRLTLDERKLLRLLQAALNVSDYTDKVDILYYGNKAKRMAAQIREMCAILSGLVIANDYSKGQQLLKDKNYGDNAPFFQNIFEIGRRYKIMNPEKMRSEYGKLVYMLQDSMAPHVQEILNFKCVKSIRTVFSLLEERDALNVLSDQYIALATKEIVADGRTRQEIYRETKMKERAVEYISQKYSNDKISEEEIKLCLYSICDNHSYLRTSRDAVDKMIKLLTTFFSPDTYEEGYSLAIAAGHNGARLTHSHRRQYHYVLQSMLLWREVAHDMFKLWYLAEEDLLDGTNPYHLTDTGQGLNRVQEAPRIWKAIHRILAIVQQKVDQWIGSSVIHLGDHNVPNALMFIDKYNQVPRILNPIVLCIDKIDELMLNPKLAKYIESLGGPNKVKKDILVDFFRHAFDGSGADNFFDAGSCIDGRLTSAWNWCSKLEKKSFFPIFLLTGFIGFDGQF
jgi:hypothetical protein